MTAGALRDAPPPTPVDGLLAVPIDITAVTASITIDAATSSATATANVTFKAGVVTGNPVLDLRQSITALALDGAPLPVAAFAHHDLGGGPGAEMRVLDAMVTAGSVHTLTISYDVGAPHSPAGGSYAPALTFAAGPRVRLSFGFTDLVPARYLESWVPANLIYDAYPISIELRVVGTAVQHTVITNAALIMLAVGHWRLDWPSTSTAMSTLVELRASDTVVGSTGSAILPVSGRSVTIEAWKLTGGAADLSTQLADIRTHLIDNENAIGPYPHGYRFVAFFNTGGMEYDGGTTTGTSALRHETHHSWWGRGWRPASQPDGWIDEGWTVYHDDGGAGVAPFDFTDPPVTLRPDNPWIRATSSNAYGDGSRFFEGLAGLVGAPTLRTQMRQFWAREQSQPSTTVRMEEYLVRTTGEPRIVEAFHRFAYGFADATPAADLWLRDDPAHAGGEAWDGRFWDSPDLWIRNIDDDGLTHQAPEFGQDNYFYARIRNRSTSSRAQHCVVTFAVKPWAGTEFSYPGDWLPAIAAVAAFDIGPGEERVVKARWPRELVPAAGMHVCWLAAVLGRGDSPAAGAHTWESNALAQKNLTVVDVAPNGWWTLPFVTGSWLVGRRRALYLELIRPPEYEELVAFLVQRSGRAFDPQATVKVPGEIARALVPAPRPIPGLPLDLDAPADRGDAPPRPVALPEALGWEFPPGARSQLRMSGAKAGQLALGLAIQVPRGAPLGDLLELDLLARDGKGGRVVGGLALKIRVVARTQREQPADAREGAATLTR